jgi:hypothetical protein
MTGHEFYLRHLEYELDKYGREGFKERLYRRQSRMGILLKIPALIFVSLS